MPRRDIVAAHVLLLECFVANAPEEAADAVFGGGVQGVVVVHVGDEGGDED